MVHSVSTFKRFMATLTKTGMQGRRHAICYQFSGGRTESSRELDDNEMLAAIKELEANNLLELDKANIMRRKIISMAHELAWKTAGGKIDMKRIDAWCVKYGYLSKALNKYTLTELPKLVTAFEIFYNKFIKAL